MKVVKDKNSQIGSGTTLPRSEPEGSSRRESLRARAHALSSPPRIKSDDHPRAQVRSNFGEPNSQIEKPQVSTTSEPLGARELEVAIGAPLITKELRRLGGLLMRVEGGREAPAAELFAETIWNRAVEGNHHFAKMLLDRLDGPIIQRTELLAAIAQRPEPEAHRVEALERIYDEEEPLEGEFTEIQEPTEDPSGSDQPS